jgi:hypothetical protein
MPTSEICQSMYDADPLRTLLESLATFLRYVRLAMTMMSTLFIFHQLPDSFAEELEAHGVTPTPALLTHCRRELFHGVWRILLDTAFCDTYIHGIVVRCPDGIQRRIFPRIFTYSADYPEKYAPVRSA